LDTVLNLNRENVDANLVSNSEILESCMVVGQVLQGIQDQVKVLTLDLGMLDDLMKLYICKLCQYVLHFWVVLNEHTHIVQGK
jgi:hypothetical protein